MTGPSVLIRTLLASSGETAAIAGRIQRRYALCAGFGFAMLALLGLVQETWHIWGAASGSPRQLRSTSDAFANALAEELLEGTALFSATNASRCVYLTESPKKGLRPQIGACSTRKVQPTRFQLPEGNSGLIKVASHPSLCLDAPGGGLLQLWSCNDVQKIKHLEFTLHPEPPGWIGVPHFDLADKGDAENMSASDLKAVTERVEELGYAGFSVFKGRAFLKNFNHLTLKDLNYMGTGDPCVFYFRRDTEGDVSIRLTAHPDTCIHAPTKLGESEVRMAPCSGSTGTESASEGAWNAGMVFRAEEDAKLSTGDGTPVQEFSPKPAPEPAETKSPSPAPVEETVTLSTTPVLVVDEGESGEETTVKPSEDTANMNRLIIFLNVENVDYTKLNSKPLLKTKFKNVIQEDVATMAGLGYDNVAVKLGPGSVQANITLSLPATNKSEDVRSLLQFVALDKKVASNIRSVEGIDDVASGRITVRSYETTDQHIAGSKQIQFPFAILLTSVALLVAVLVVFFIFMVRGKSTRNVSTSPKVLAPHKTEELGENLGPCSKGADDGPAENGGSTYPPTENDNLLGESNGNDESAVPTEDHEEKHLLGEPNGNDESAVPTEEHEEKQEEVAGSGEAEEEETPVVGDSQPPAAAAAADDEDDPELKAALAAGSDSQQSAAAAPADDEDDPELKAALAASLRDNQHRNDDLNNPFPPEDKAEVPGAKLAG